jgi:hypothetical protein
MSPVIVTIRYGERDAGSRWLHQNLDDMAWSLDKVLKKHHHASATVLKQHCKTVIYATNADCHLIASYIDPFVAAMHKERFVLTVCYTGGAL